MKHFFSIILSVTIIVSLTECHKVDKITCYECKGFGSNPDLYSDAGCLTKEQWNEIRFTNPQGDDIDKNANCRKKR
ncbi:MAG TPA: hypothetical protein PK987_06785 [Ferruginibacter sp.]|nr:hypothetical protein [Ferruginibacter sp.]